MSTLGSPSAAYATTASGVVKPVCPPAKPRHVTCFAMVLHRTSPLVRGARTFKLAAGASAVGPAGGLTPSDLATAYSLGSALSTAGGTQTVAIVDWGTDAQLASDLTTFDTMYGLPACTTANVCLKILNETGGTSPLPTDQGTSVEISLDVEVVHSMCQKCKIVLIEANSNAFSDTEASVNEAVKLGATEVSNSYGGPDTTGVSAADKAAYSHPGVVITVSAGDDGFYDWDQFINTPMGGPAANPGAPNFPAELATVVSVGGTSLYLNQNATRQSETAWNENGTKAHVELALGAPQGASGGGCSLFISAPAWQPQVSDWAQTACGAKRLSNDVSAIADPYTGFDIYDTDTNNNSSPGWQTIGGTSLSSPVIAAMYALAGGAQGITNPALTVYGHLGSNALYDVTSAGIGFCGGEGAAQCWYGTTQNPNTLAFNGVALGVIDCDYPATGTTPSAGDLACDAGPGYDGPTGVGTPTGLGAFTAVHPTATISGPASVASGTTGTWIAPPSDPFPGGSVSSFTWNWGDGTANTVTTTDAAAHTYTTGGVNRTITLTMSDNYGVTGTATHPVSVCCAGNGSGTMTTPTTTVTHGSAGNTITFTYTAAPGGTSGGAVTVAVPTGWSAPSTTTTAAGYTTSSTGTVAVSGQTVTVSGLNLTGGQTVTITYGSKAKSGPGATAPSTAVGPQTWTTDEKSTAAGTLTAIASSPKITIS